MKTKTAISIPDEIFKEVNGFAKEHCCSRSEVFVTAVKEYLEKVESKKLLDALNEAYADVETPEETKTRAKAKKRFAKTVLKDEPY